MNAPNIARLRKRPEVEIWRTLWDQCPSLSSLRAIGTAFLIRRPRAKEEGISLSSVFAIGTAFLIFILAYLPNLRALVAAWNEDSNNSHGYLVIPIALYIVWQRLSDPGLKTASSAVPAAWWGWVFLAVVLALRVVLYEHGSEWSENSTLILAVIALVWCFGSWPLLSRVWPAVVFLVFMLPLPQIVNQLIALDRQRLAATSSRFLLQLTGMWVIQDGNIINLSTPHGTERLDVALACSGLRMLMSMAATIVATVILLPLPNWKRITLFLSIVPIALVSNMARIVATGWCYYYLLPGDDPAKHLAQKHLAHDWSGYLMMPLALVMVGLELALLAWLVPKETADDQLVIPLLMTTEKDAGKTKQGMTSKSTSKKRDRDLDEV
jgi:exosortase